jgi:hypothetical protein
MTEECQELKNIKYQTMLLNSNSKIVSNKTNSDNLDEILKNETDRNRKKPWSKLGRSTKIKKFHEFVDEYSKEQSLNCEEKTQLLAYLSKSLDRKKLQRVKDLTYDTKTQKIKAIPGLVFNKNKRKFTIRRVDRKRTTLKGLAPPKRRKNKIDIKEC